MAWIHRLEQEKLVGASLKAQEEDPNLAEVTDLPVSHCFMCHRRCAGDDSEKVYAVFPEIHYFPGIIDITSEAAVVVVVFVVAAVDTQGNHSTMQSPAYFQGEVCIFPFSGSSSVSCGTDRLSRQT